MADSVAIPQGQVIHRLHDPNDNYLTNPKGLWSWLTTVDHKRIGVMYLWSILLAFFIGGIFALLVRIELLTPKTTIMGAEMYNRAFTMHGVVMVFLFIIPSIPAALGNFFLPIMLGAKDVAFPRVNLVSYYIYVVGAVFGLVCSRRRGRRYRVDVLHALLHFDQRTGYHHVARRFHHGVLLDIHRSQLHRHGS